MVNVKRFFFFSFFFLHRGNAFEAKLIRVIPNQKKVVRVKITFIPTIFRLSAFNTTWIYGLCCLYFVTVGSDIVRDDNNSVHVWKRKPRSQRSFWKSIRQGPHPRTGSQAYVVLCVFFRLYNFIGLHIVFSLYYITLHYVICWVRLYRNHRLGWQPDHRIFWYFLWFKWKNNTCLVPLWPKWFYSLSFASPRKTSTKSAG